MNIALITAAGSGQRMHQDIPKQFINVYDKPVIIYTLEAFQNHPDIDAIIVASLEGWHEILKAYAKQFNITKLKWVVSGGKTGQDSIRNCLLELEKSCSGDDTVLIHDGNRAMVSPEIISDCIAKCEAYGSAIAAVPCTEAILRTCDRVTSRESVPRQDLMKTQTPHGFRLSKLLWAHNQAKERGISNSVATCTLMIELGEDVFFSAGSEKNIKLTTTDDIEIFKALLDTKKDDWLK